MRHGIEAIENVIQFRDEYRPVANQQMWTARKRVIDAAREREDGPAMVVAGGTGGDEGAAFFVGFDDEHAARHAADNTVATREVFTRGRGAQREFADDRAALSDRSKQA